MKDLCLFKDSGQIKLTMLIRGRLISLDCVSSTAATGQDVKAIIPITPFSDKLDTVKTKRNKLIIIHLLAIKYVNFNPTAWKIKQF